MNTLHHNGLWISSICCIGIASMLTIAMRNYYKRILEESDRELHHARTSNHATKIEIELSKEKLKVQQQDNETLRQSTKELEKRIEKEISLRQQERTGRIAAEKENRMIVSSHIQMNGYSFKPIGHVKSCFIDRRGTPRQGILAPSVRGRIIMDKSISPAAFDSLEEFSHIWVIFVFHENTNVAKAMRTQEKNQTLQAKIRPPRLNGKRVGIFSTRTPHRPNSIGLSCVRLDKIDGHILEISAHDFVDGTPVLDVKPYVPYDKLAHFECPAWIRDSNSEQKKAVIFTATAEDQLRDLVEMKALKFYDTLESVKKALQEILVLDIRSVHQGRGKSTANNAFKFHFDNLEIEFKTLEDSIQIVECCLFDI